MIEIDLETAETIAKAAQSRAKSLGISITVSIVDEAGRLVYCARGNGTGFLTTDTSQAKAVASSAFRKPTKELVELQKSNPAFWSAVPSLFPGVLPTTGAVPIVKNGQVIGAVGVGGGSPDQDHECALAGISGLTD
jgi:uncharacterized protein GlcG (DUF336 family)